MNHDVANTKLTLDDIADLRAYEREREEFRERVAGLKRIRRVHVGDKLTFVFENRDTIRFQIQEMARVEKIISDEGIQAELDVYNPLIPEPGALSATMFLELTSNEELRQWLPKLVGVERSVELRLGPGDDAVVVPARLDADHEAQLTRDDTTASVHYLSWELPEEAMARFEQGPVRLAVTHPEYDEQITLEEATVESLLDDLR